MARRTAPVTAQEDGQASWVSRAVAFHGAARELGFGAGALALYLVVRWHTADRTTEAIQHSRDILALERVLGVDWEHETQQLTAAVPGASTILTQFYVWGYFPTLVCVVVWLFARDRAVYERLRNGLLFSGVIGLSVYAFYPCAPPWIGGSGFTDTVTQSAVQALARPAVVTNHLGALPSFHVGWVVLVAWFVFGATRSRVIRVVCLLHPALMAYAVLATGNHWVLDLPAGVLLAAGGVLGDDYVAHRPLPLPRRL